LFDSYDVRKIHSNPGFRYDLFPGGEEAARNRLITDFFGNVQSVEVQNGTEREDELLGLSRAIAELRRMADEEDAKGAAGERRISNESIEVPRDEGVKEVRGAKLLSDDDWWTKKIYGATAVAGCALLWGIGSFLEGA